MEDVSCILPLLACSASLLAVPGILLLRRYPNAREAVTFGAGALKLGLVLAMLPMVLDGKRPLFTFCEILPGVPLQFRVDGLGMMFALVAASLWIVTSMYSVGYMRAEKEHSQTRFYAFFAVSLCATLGVAFSANLFTLYLFYEMLSMSTYPLVTHHNDKEARGGGRTYLTYLLGTSVAFALPAMIYAYVVSGGSAMDFSAGGFLAQNVEGPGAVVLLLLFVFGFAKAGLMPFHSWLPNAMVAPTPVSALLHAVAVVKVGVFCIIRVFTGVFGTEFLAELDIASVVSWIAAFTVITSSLIALTQDNLKRLLAFSTVGQLGYIVLGVSLLSPLGVTGSILHIGMHAFGKITLFFCAGAIYVALHKKYVSELTGIGRKMPVTMTAFAIGALSVIGLPVTGGLVSKWYLVMGTAQSGQIALLVVFLVSSILNACYFLPIVYKAFLCRPEESKFEGGIKEAPLACVIPLCVTAGLSVLSFFFPTLFLKLAGLMTGVQ